MVEGNQSEGRVIVSVEVISHAAQDYETVGNYRTENGTLRVFVSDMGNPDFEFLVAIHELVEAYLCKKRGITDEVITDFDKTFEVARAPGNVSEPGDDPASPYQNEHCLATAVERMTCAALGVKWAEYEKAVLSLGAPCAS